MSWLKAKKDCGTLLRRLECALWEPRVLIIQSKFLLTGANEDRLPSWNGRYFAYLISNKQDHPSQATLFPSSLTMSRWYKYRVRTRRWDINNYILLIKDSFNQHGPHRSGIPHW